MLYYTTARSDRISENMALFFEDLKNSYLTDNGKVLCIPSTNEDIPLFQIYIRDCWIKIYDLIYDNVKNTNYNQFLVTGTPGIGNSLFSYYFMWRWMQEKEYVGLVWQRARYDVIGFTLTEGVFNYDRYMGEMIHNLPLIVDIEEKMYPTVIGPRFTLVCSSPDRKRYKVFQKSDRFKGYVQPPWTLFELVDAHKKIVVLKKYDLDVVHSQFAIYGGVPREVFQRGTYGDSSMVQAIRMKGASALSLFLLQDWEKAHNDNDLTPVLLHIDTTDHDTFCLEKGYLRPASGYVVSMLKERNLFNLRSTYETYVKLMRMSYLAEAAGTSFETLSILLLFMSVEYKFKLISVLS